MAICTFLGHKTVYDRDLYEKLLDAVYMIAEQNDKLEFLFCNQGAFYDLYVAAALDIRQHFPQKEITITWVVQAEDREAFAESLRQGKFVMPPCVIDRVIAPPPISGSQMAAHKKLERWVIQQSAYLVAYLYFAFCGPENQQYFYAKNRGLPLLDLTSRETAAYILESIDTLPEREQLVLKRTLEGQTLADTGQLLGISSSAVQQRLKHGCRTLRMAAEGRLRRRKREEPAPPARCGIFALGEATPERLSAFERAVLFVMGRYHVTEFRVAAEYCHTGYMSALLRLARGAARDVRLIAVTYCPDMPEEAQERAASALVPPCDAVENMDPQSKLPRTQRLRTAKAMIAQSDFCICNLTNSPLAGSLEKHMSKIKGTKVLDIGKPFPGT